MQDQKPLDNTVLSDIWFSDTAFIPLVAKDSDYWISKFSQNLPNTLKFFKRHHNFLKQPIFKKL